MNKENKNYYFTDCVQHSCKRQLTNKQTFSFSSFVISRMY